MENDTGKEENELRLYGKSSMNPKGAFEDLERCREEVWTSDWNSQQCSRKRGHGLHYPNYSYLEDLMCYVMGIAEAQRPDEHLLSLRLDYDRIGDYHWGWKACMPYGGSHRIGILDADSPTEALENLLLKLIE